MAEQQLKANVLKILERNLKKHLEEQEVKFVLSLLLGILPVLIVGYIIIYSLLNRFSYAEFVFHTAGCFLGALLIIAFLIIRKRVK